MRLRARLAINILTADSRGCQLIFFAMCTLRCASASDSEIDTIEAIGVETRRGIKVAIGGQSVTTADSNRCSFSEIDILCDMRERAQ